LKIKDNVSYKYWDKSIPKLMKLTNYPVWPLGFIPGISSQENIEKLYLIEEMKIIYNQPNTPKNKRK
jgi:hypothetical protein